MNKIQETNRIIEFDIIKCLAIFLVLWGHSLQHLSDMGKNNDMFTTISMFHMPLFMMISGFFSRSSIDQSSLKILLTKKAKQLLYPCISFGILFLTVVLLLNYFKTHTLSLSASFAVKYFYDIFWFLKSLFFCFLILYISNKITNSKLWGGVVAICLCQFIPLFKINWMMPFFVTGYWLSAKLDFLLKYKHAVAICSTIIFLTLWIFLFGEASTWSDKISYCKGHLLNGDTSVISLYFIVQIERFTVGISGALMVVFSTFSLSGRLNDHPISKWISGIGRETLGIYIIQTLLLETILASICNLSVINTGIFTFIITPVISAMMMYICYRISLLIARSPRIKKTLYL